VVSERAFAARTNLRRARVVLERALVAGTLDLSWGRSPLPAGASARERTPGPVRVDYP
jgi:hypothetical protein